MRSRPPPGSRRETRSGRHPGRFMVILVLAGLLASCTSTPDGAGPSSPAGTGPSTASQASDTSPGSGLRPTIPSPSIGGSEAGARSPTGTSTPTGAGSSTTAGTGSPTTGTNGPSTTPSDTPTTTAPTTPAAPPRVVLQPPTLKTRVIWAADPVALAIAMSRAIFRGAPAVVLVAGHSATAVTKAAGRADALGIPLLLTGGGRPESAAGADATLTTEIDRLGARSVLALDRTSRAAAERLHGPDVITDPARLPRIKPTTPIGAVTVLVPAGDVAGMTTGIAAATATARAAGARIQPVRGSDPRTDPKAIAALAAHPPAAVIGLGPDFGPADRLARRVATAATGVQLPGGGQVMFPGRRLLALYGNPYDSRLGALGQQDLPAAIARAKQVARSYHALSDVPVVPTFEIIATVATAGAGPDGDYSAESSVDDLKPWVDAATEAGLYVILDLQPGRASLLDQAQRYAALLTNPSVGLALDPEWKLGPGQLPLQQIGSVDAAEVNQVIDWLGTLTTRHRLPQKLLVLHQFRLAMLPDEDSIDTANDQVSLLIHMDGQGAPSLKDGTWRAVLAAAPPGVHFGWKNFYVKDIPMLTPAQTMARSPQPVMISYQ